MAKTTVAFNPFSDKLKILKLNRHLKKKSISAIFKTPETTTLAYLQKLGFSEAMLQDFFKPFFSGIFLEPNLDTSSRMFEFVYKMFGDGLAVIPKSGMQAISNQLKKGLKNTKIHFSFYFSTFSKRTPTKSYIKVRKGTKRY